MVPGARSLLLLLQRGERNDNPYRRNVAAYLCKTYRAPLATSRGSRSLQLTICPLHSYCACRCVGQSVVFLTEIVLTVLLYVLLRPVSRTLALIAAFARLALAIIQGINLLPLFIALLLLSGAGYLTVFEPDQLDALVLLFLNAHGYGVFVWQLFFGFHLFVLGFLIFKSGYFPRILGILMVLGSLGYLLDSFGNILFPNYAEIFGVVVGVTAVIGEVLFFLWLLIKGVNVERYNERAQQLR